MTETWVWSIGNWRRRNHSPSKWPELLTQWHSLTSHPQGL